MERRVAADVRGTISPLAGGAMGERRELPLGCRFGHAVLRFG